MRARGVAVTLVLLRFKRALNKMTPTFGFFPFWPIRIEHRFSTKDRVIEVHESEDSSSIRSLLVGKLKSKFYLASIAFTKFESIVEVDLAGFKVAYLEWKCG